MKCLPQDFIHVSGFVHCCKSRRWNCWIRSLKHRGVQLYVFSKRRCSTRFRITVSVLVLPSAFWYYRQGFGITVSVLVLPSAFWYYRQRFSITVSVFRVPHCFQLCHNQALRPTHSVTRRYACCKQIIIFISCNWVATQW